MRLFRLFHSLRARLIGSYVLLASLTLSLAGGLTFPLIDYLMGKHERDHLFINARSLAAQALPLLEPAVRLKQLTDLAVSFSFLGDVRVRISDADRHVLIDTGQEQEVSGAIWALLVPDTDPVVSPSRTDQSSSTDSANIPAPEKEIEDRPLWHITKTKSSMGSHLRIEPTEKEPTLYAGEGQKNSSFSLIENYPPSLDTRQRNQRNDHIEGQAITIALADQSNFVKGYLELSHGRKPYETALHTAIWTFVAVACVALAFAALLGILASTRIANPIRRLNSAARLMGDGNLTIRTEIKGPDEIGQLAQQFDRMASRLQENFQALEREQSTLKRFIADASHELRSPLSALSNSIEILQSDKFQDDPTRRYFLRQSEKQIERLEWVTRNLLDLSRLDAEFVELNMEAVRTQELIEACAALYQEAIQTKGLVLRLNVAGPEHYVRCDRCKLMTALSNLIDNAIKFTPSGGLIELGAHSDPIDKSPVFWVKDNGIGIAGDDVPHIFERFYRGHNGNTEGSGLGLAIVERIITLHGGTISVESGPFEGSRFLIRLPRAESPKTDAL